MLKPQFLYQDDDLLVINKPAGQIVNRATSHRQESLQEYFAQQWHLPLINEPAKQNASAEDIFLSRQGMVHRLDKDTSGLLLWAKNPPTLVALLQQFQKRQVKKTYQCLVHGFFSDQDGRISLPLARKRTNRKIMAVDPHGREAITLFQVQERYQFNLQHQLPVKNKLLINTYQGFSLLLVTPQTGRTHQIRAHLTHLHHPLVGDGAYLSSKKAKLDKLWCERQFLHAYSLTFTHPRNHKKLHFQADLPADLQQALTWLIPA